MSRALRPSPTPHKRQRLDIDSRRTQLLELGERIFFGDRAYDEISIDEVAREAGISKGLLYHYFPTKRDFYVAVLRRMAARLIEVVTPPENMAPVERLQTAIDAYLSFVAAHAKPFRALMQGGIGSDVEVAEVIESTRSAFISLLLNGVGLDLATLEPLVFITARAWLGSVEAASLAWLGTSGIPALKVRKLLVNELGDLVARAFPGFVPPAWKLG